MAEFANDIVMNLELKNYISGGVFKYGIDSVFGDIPDNQLVFLILFNSEAENSKKVVISSKSLRLYEDNNNGELRLVSKDDESGATLIVDTIADTKNFLPENSIETSKVDGFAFIRCAEDPDSKEGLITFPNLYDPSAKVILKGKLDNKPIFSKTSKVTISTFEINFGVEGYK